MHSPGKTIGAFYRKIVIWSLVVHIVWALTIWSFVWGTIALLLRLTTSTSNMTLLWGAAGFPLVAALSAWRAKRRFPDPIAVRAYLDNLAGCGGMLMADVERDIGHWQIAMPKSLPELRWNGARPLAIFGVAVGFLALCFLLPIQPRVLNANSPLDIGRKSERLGEQLTVLKEEKILNSERAEHLKQKLEQIRDQAAGKDPVKTLEALDHLNDVVRQTSHQAAETAAKESSALANLEAAIEALQMATQDLTPTEITKLMKELAGMGKKAADESEKLKDELDPDLASELASGKLSASRLPDLGSAARSAMSKVKKVGKKLYDAKLIDADQLKQCEGKGKCDAKALAEFLKKNGSKSSLGDAMTDLAGRGGVSDDLPSATELTFGDQSSTEGTKFREEALSPGDLSALKDSQRSGVSSTMPELDKKSEAPVSGRLQNAASGGGSANSAAVLPQHRGAVGRYFERDKK